MVIKEPVMIKALKHHVYINISVLLEDKSHIEKRNDRYYMFDGGNEFEIAQETYFYLEKKGVRVYERECPTIEPI